jgi:DNA-binding transcriptional MocR family regulator
MHLVITLPNIVSDKEITAKAAKERIWLLPLSTCYSGEKKRQGFILGFGSTPAGQMGRAVRKFRAILDSVK